jgi:hypothetical protein
MSISTRVTIYFQGHTQGQLAISETYCERRTIRVPDQFTMADAKEAARIALQFAEGDSPRFNRVRVDRIAFN